DQKGAKRETKSDERGNYSFKGLFAGTYALEVTSTSLPVLTLENISLARGQELNLDAMLQGQLPKANAPPEVTNPTLITAPRSENQFKVQSDQPPVQKPLLPRMAQSQPEKLGQTPHTSMAAGKGSISGVATDQTGAVIAGATVVLTDAAGQAR